MIDETRDFRAGVADIIRHGSEAVSPGAVAMIALDALATGAFRPAGSMQDRRMHVGHGVEKCRRKLAEGGYSFLGRAFSSVA